ncbi:hypothetical protein AMJ80_06785 [bacterium SM23_31]|nr:MAG: hypothetical protein AMJ80_06785 [bacterium SM23_31]
MKVVKTDSQEFFLKFPFNKHNRNNKFYSFPPEAAPPSADTQLNFKVNSSPCLVLSTSKYYKNFLEHVDKMTPGNHFSEAIINLYCHFTHVVKISVLSIFLCFVINNITVYTIIK